MSENPAELPGLEGAVVASDLVAFQSGTVVSRTVVRKPAGTITAFAFDAGEGLSEHTAPYDAVAINLEGEADISISGTPHRLGAGQLLRLPAGKPHSVKAIAPFKMLLIMIRA
ncbi:MAG: cupin domain-containing protein [Acidobacteriota bacterium]